MVEDCYELFNTRAALYGGDMGPSLLGVCAYERGAYQHKSNVESTMRKARIR